MPLLFKQRVAFIHIPKTGGTTVEDILLRAFPEDFCFLNTHRFGPLKYDYESEMMREMRYRVALHGCSQKVSPQHWTYNDLKQVIPDLDEWWSFAFVRSPWPRLYSEYRYLHRFLKRCAMSFEEWVPDVLGRVKADPSAHDNHLRSQCEFVGSRTEIFRFENLAEGIAKVAARLGIQDYHMQQHFKSGETDEYKRVYSPELIKLVADHYHEDLRRFGYLFD